MNFRKLIYVILALIFFASSLDAQTIRKRRPDQFPVDNTPDATDAIYTQEAVNGIPTARKIYFSDAKSFFTPIVNTTAISFVPSTSGNSSNFSEFVTDPNGDKWFIGAAPNGYAVKLFTQTVSGSVNDDGITIRTLNDTLFVERKNVVSEYFDPVWLGAVGDGVANDFTVLENTIDSASAGGKDVLIAKNYNLGGGTITLPSGMNIRFTLGGKLINGSVRGNNSTHYSGLQQCYDNITILGKWNTQQAYIEYFVSDLTKDTSNFKGLLNALQLANEVHLLSETYPLATVNLNTSGLTDQDVIIKGVGRDSSILILEDRHVNNGANANAYFGSSDEYSNGNNLHFEDITVRTRDFIDNVFDNGNAYFLASVETTTSETQVAPDIDYIRMINCDFEGNIRLEYSSDGSNQTLDEFINSGVKNILVQGCETNHAHSFLVVRGVVHKQVSIIDNTIKNIRGAWFFSPINASLPDPYEDPAYDARVKFDFIGNVVQNDSVYAPVSSGAYMAAVVIKGRNAKIINNTFDYLVTADTDTETYPFYCSVSNDLTVSGNKSSNVFGRDNGFVSPLVKFKGARKVNMFDNTFRVDKEILLQTGIIDSINQDLATINKTDLQMALIDVDDAPDTTRIADWQIKNNSFSMPILNMYTDAHDVFNFIFENNVLNIGYIGDKDAGNWGGVVTGPASTLWNFRNEKDGPLQNKQSFVSRGNDIFVGGIETNRFRYTYGYGLRVSNDTIRDFNLMTLDDNIYIDDAMVSVSAFNVDKANIQSKVFGRNSDFVFDYGTTSVDDDPEINSIFQDTYVSETKNFGQEEGIFEIAPTTDSKHQTSFVASDSLILWEGNLNTWNNNISNERPLKCNIDYSYQDSAGVFYKKSYKIIFTNTGRQWRFYSGDAVVAYDPAGSSEDDYTLQGSGTGDVDLALHSFTNRFHYLTLRNTENIKNLSVSLKVGSFASTTSTDWDSYVTPASDLITYGNYVTDNFGVGSVAHPTHKLQVIGTSRFQGNAEFTGNIVANGTGLTTNQVLGSNGSIVLGFDYDPPGDLETATNANSPLTISSNTDIVELDGSGGNVSVTIPQGAGLVDKKIKFVRIDNNPGNTVTITAASGSIIGTYSTANLNDYFELWSNGTNYFVR